MRKYLLSIDQGTTSCRAILFDAAGNTVGIAQREFRQYFPEAGWVEHDALEILDTQILCIKDCLAAARLADSRIDGSLIAAVGISNQRETTVVWDRHTGQPVYNAIVWQCRRTADIVSRLQDEAAHFRRVTGLIPDAYFSGPKIQWILDNVPGARSKAEKGDLLFGTIDTWLVWNLTKERHHVTEASNASRTMLFNLESMSWDHGLADLLRIPGTMLPKIMAADAEFGTTNPDVLGFAAPILAVLGDQQAALFGQACFGQGMAKCTYGTGGFLLVNVGHDVNIVDGLLTTVGWQRQGEPPAYALEGAIFAAGSAVQWLRDGLGILASSDESAILAEQLTSNEGVYFVPALVGLGSPWWNADVRGTICGITRGTNRAHFARAALESMAYQVKDVVVQMETAGLNVKELRVDGGAARNDFMLQFQTDLLQIPVIRSAQIESTAWGVAALAGVSAGVIKGLGDIEQAWKRDTEFFGQKHRAADYRGWKHALSGAFAVSEG